jgi:hypothetical protein
MADESTTSIDTADVLAVDDAVQRTSGSTLYGVTREGFVAKPFARLLAEKLALARNLLGDDLDLTSGSAIRKILEISALEDARTWAALSAMYDDSFVVSAQGDALSRLGDELGVQRPYLEARGSVTLRLQGDIPPGFSPLTIPRGARLLTPGGHHAATDETVLLSPDSRERSVPVTAFFPGPEHNLDPTQPADDGTFPQKLDRFNFLDESLQGLVAAENAAGASLVQIDHTLPLTGGQLQWPDLRYRSLLLRAPRSIWTVEAVRLAVSLVPGVRQVQVRDGWGGLDINQSIFGNFNFAERVFSSERDLGTPYYFTVLIAPTASAIWEGQDGLRAAVESAIEDIRPISIFPQVIRAEEVSVGVSADLVVRGLPLPSGSPATVNGSAPAVALKQRLVERIRRYIEGLQFGEPVRASQVTWALMNEPGVADVRDLKLLKFPPSLQPEPTAAGLTVAPGIVFDPGPQVFDCGTNIDLQVNEIAIAVDDASRLTIV